jgi:hypothetical protein
MGAPGSGAGVGVGVGVGAVAERRGGDMLLDVMMDGWVPPIDPRGFLPAVVLCVCRACGLWPVGVHVMRCSSLRASVEHGYHLPLFLLASFPVDLDLRVFPVLAITKLLLVVTAGQYYCTPRWWPYANSLRINGLLGESFAFCVY